MKEKILQQISNKYKGSSETTMNNYTPANWTNKKRGYLTRSTGACTYC